MQIIQGLSGNEVEESRKKYGNNTIPDSEPTTFWDEFKETFNDPMIRILLVIVVIMLIMYSMGHIKLIKPGIGEATRVLLRRLPWKILVHSKCDDENLGHIYKLAREKGVEIVEYPLRNYMACGLIQSLAEN